MDRKRLAAQESREVRFSPGGAGPIRRGMNEHPRDDADYRPILSWDEIRPPARARQEPLLRAA